MHHARPFVLLTLAVLLTSPTAHATGRGDVFLWTNSTGVWSEFVLAVENDRALVKRVDGGHWVSTADLDRPALHAPVRTLANPFVTALLPHEVVRGETVSFRARALDRLVADAAGKIYAIVSGGDVVSLDAQSSLDPSPLSLRDGPAPRVIPVLRDQSIADAIAAYDRRFADQPNFKPVLLAPTIDFLGTYLNVDVASFRAQADERATKVRAQQITRALAR